MVDYLAVFILLLAVIAVTTFWLGVLAARPPADSPARAAAAKGAPEHQAKPVVRPPVPLALLGTLLLFVIWQSVALLLVFWALAFAQVGFASFAPLLLPVLVGFGYAWSKGALRW